MQIIKPSIEFWGQTPSTKKENLAFIEKAGRVCYKSEEKIKEGTAEPFVRKLIDMKHLAMAEHSNFVIRASEKDVGMTLAPLIYGRYLSFTRDKDGHLFAGGNLTAWAVYYRTLTVQQAQSSSILPFFQPFIMEYGDLFDFDNALFEDSTSPWKICPHDEIPVDLRRYTVKFTCDRGVSHELVRHRPCSFAQESTRYCDYKDGEILFIEPFWWTGDKSNLDKKNALIAALANSEQAYKKMRVHGATPQAARAVLLNNLKTEVVVTADRAEWRHIKFLRTAKDAHPDMQRVMNMIPWEMIGLK